MRSLQEHRSNNNTVHIRPQEVSSSMSASIPHGLLDSNRFDRSNSYTNNTQVATRPTLTAPAPVASALNTGSMMLYNNLMQTLVSNTGSQQTGGTELRPLDNMFNAQAFLQPENLISTLGNMSNLRNQIHPLIMQSNNVSVTTQADTLRNAPHPMLLHNNVLSSPSVVPSTSTNDTNHHERLDDLRLIDLINRVQQYNRDQEHRRRMEEAQILFYVNNGFQR